MEYQLGVSTSVAGPADRGGGGAPWALLPSEINPDLGSEVASLASYGNHVGAPAGRALSLRQARVNRARDGRGRAHEPFVVIGHYFAIILCSRPASHLTVSANISSRRVRASGRQRRRRINGARQQ